MNTGSYNIGGSVGTASGLLFIGAFVRIRQVRHVRKQGSVTNLLCDEQDPGRSLNQSEKEITSMKQRIYNFFAAITLTAAGLALTGCQQTAPAPAGSAPATTTTSTQAPPPSSTTESTTTKSTEVKPADPDNPDAGAVKQTTTDSTTTKQKN